MGVITVLNASSMKQENRTLFLRWLFICVSALYFLSFAFTYHSVCRSFDGYQA
jgi:hypothetical protein